jgi:cleavage stimulation factor subunit 3
MNDLSTGGSQVRATIAQAYEFVLSHVGVDPKAGAIWLEYLQFIKSAPTNSQWEEQQQQDQLRRTYQRAVATPLSNVEQLWREYDLFENTANQATVRSLTVTIYG